MSDAAHDSRPPGQFYCPTCEKSFADGDVCPNDNTRLVRLRVADPLIGRVLDGRYTIQEKLGQGGMGAVYRGSQHSVGREVAIKLVTPTLVSDHDVIKRFLREAKLASRLSHPNAVAVMDFGQTDDGLFYLVMELVTGRTLDQVIKAEKKLKPERVIRIGMQVCDALEGAHALQIVHRDLKPANIMLMAQGRDHVKVLDFGLAKSLAPDQTSTTMTNAGSLLGTPAFMPPELALGQPCDGRADLYSLGCVLYLLGSGRLPFVSESAHELIAMHGTQAAPPMEGVPPQLADVVDQLLRKNPSERFQSAAETREALEAALDASRMNTPVSGISRVGMSTPSGSLPVATTPVPGRASSPSMPSSAKPMQTLLSTPTPAHQSRPRASTELERIGNSDTILPTAAAAMTSAASIDSAPPAKKSRAMVFVGLAALLVVGVAVAMFAMKGKGSASTTPPATQPTVEKQPEITKQPAHDDQPPLAKQPDQPTGAKQPDQPAGAKQPEQTATGSATTSDVTKVVPDVTKVVPDVTKVAPEVTKVVPDVTVNKHHHPTTKTDTTKTTKTDTTKTTKTDTTKTPPAGTGSAGPAKLPF